MAKKSKYMYIYNPIHKKYSAALILFYFRFIKWLILKVANFTQKCINLTHKKYSSALIFAIFASLGS